MAIVEHPLLTIDPPYGLVLTAQMYCTLYGSKQTSAAAAINYLIRIRLIPWPDDIGPLINAYRSMR